MNPYVENPFRILGLPSTASFKESARSANRLLQLIELGENPAITGLFPFLGSPPLDREVVKRADKEIQDPVLRIRRELYWPSGDFPFYKECQQLLATARYDEFIKRCESVIGEGRSSLYESDTGRVQNAQLAAPLSRHFLAIFYHSAAISHALGTIVRAGETEPPLDWDRAFQYWAMVSEDSVFWSYIEQRCGLLSDPRLDSSMLEQLRAELPREILRANVSLGMQGLQHGKFGSLISQSWLVESSPFGQAHRLRALSQLAAPVKERFDREAGGIRPKLSDAAIRQLLSPSPTDGGPTERAVKLISYLNQLQEEIKKTLVPIAEVVREAKLGETEAGMEVMDGVALILRSLSLALNNDAGMPAEALEITRLARKYAAGAECLERLAEDERTLHFLSLQKEASELAKDRHFKASLEKLDEALRLASTDEERRTILEWRGQAAKMLSYEGLKPIGGAPSLGTAIYGIGTMLYGRRDADPENKSYVATLYFTILFCPIFPLAAYRVINAGRNAYRFLGKAPLKRTAFIPTAVILVIILAIAFSNSGPQGVASGTTTTTSASALNPSRQQTTSPEASGSSQSGATSENSLDRQALHDSLEQERARLDSEASELDGMRHQIDEDRQALDQQYSDLKLGSPTQAEIDSYKAATRDFNARVQAFNQLLESHKAAVAKFNEEVDRYNSMP
jgi:hypothetical protein